MSKIEILKYFWKKKFIKKLRKIDTIKKISVTHLKKVFQICDANFFRKIYFKIKTI
jgi:hypothetical protein